MKILILDGYNHQIIEGGIIGTVVPNFSRWGLTNGSKIIEVYGEDQDNEESGDISREDSDRNGG